MDSIQQATLVEENLNQLPGENQGRRDDEPPTTAAAATNSRGNGGAGPGISVGKSRSRAAPSIPINRMAKPIPTRTMVHTCVNR
jgi:hypothetical protein